VQRAQLEHLIRAAADIADDDEIVIVGSQAILASAPDAPPEMLVSMEADLFPRTHPERADVVEGAIGEGSPFHETFGYFAHGVGPETARAPAGWEERLVALRNENTRGAAGWCLEPHDLVLAKCVAGREKDWAYARAAVRAGLVQLAELRRRVPALPVPEPAREAVRAGLDALR
jgi:hypothetical protein